MPNVTNSTSWGDIVEVKSITEYYVLVTQDNNSEVSETIQSPSSVIYLATQDSTTGVVRVRVY